MQSIDTKSSRPRPETEVPKNGSTDASRDRVSRLHHWCLCWMCVCWFSSHHRCFYFGSRGCTLDGTGVYLLFENDSNTHTFTVTENPQKVAKAFPGSHGPNNMPYRLIC